MNYEYKEEAVVASTVFWLATLILPPTSGWLLVWLGVPPEHGGDIPPNVRPSPNYTEQSNP
jgi:hypothetical protein